MAEPDEELESATCPRCGLRCEKCGEARDDEQVYDVFQCDECTVDVDMEGEVFVGALTFCIRPDGSPAIVNEF